MAILQNHCVISVIWLFEWTQKLGINQRLPRPRCLLLRFLPICEWYNIYDRGMTVISFISEYAVYVCMYVHSDLFKLTPCDKKIHISVSICLSLYLRSFKLNSNCDFFLILRSIISIFDISEKKSQLIFISNKNRLVFIDTCIGELEPNQEYFYWS